MKKAALSEKKREEGNMQTMEVTNNKRENKNKTKRARTMNGSEYQNVRTKTKQNIVESSKHIICLVAHTSDGFVCTLWQHHIQGACC